MPLAGALYALIFLPAAPGGLRLRLLTWYLQQVAQVSGALIRIFDGAATVDGHDIGGSFPLRIVLDCAALDAQALFVAAVFVYPAAWRKRVMGAAVGCIIIFAFNVLRIGALYFVGVYAPASFNFIHEEVLQVILVVLSIALFALWAAWASARPRHEPSLART
ncbi:MAG: archaeosortase/exosortase family protein [Deltaproteobacteria bacterium]|nr:archaeosortase/exosortase family protein [Deltaproteobacteria bacterium]